MAVCQGLTTGPNIMNDIKSHGLVRGVDAFYPPMVLAINSTFVRSSA